MPQQGQRTPRRHTNPETSPRSTKTSAARGLWGVALACVLLCGLLVPFLGSADVQAQDGTKLDHLEFKFGKPKTVIIYPVDEKLKDAENVEAGRIYWYLPYTLKNNGDSAKKFFVTISGHSDKGRKYSDLPLAHVEKKVERVERRKFHSRADLLADGKSLDSYEEFAPGAKRECVAIFNPIDPEADTIVLEIRGLVNDVKMEDLGNGMMRVEERVLKLTFKRPGDEFYTSLDQFVFESKKWHTSSHEIKLNE